MMRLIFIVSILGNGGAERVVVNLSNYLVELGIDVSIITIYGSRKDYVIDERIKHIPIVCKSQLRLMRPIERLKKLRNIVKVINPNVVISFLADVNIHTLISLAGTSYKVLVSERNDPQRDPKKKWMRSLRDQLYKKAGGIVFQTEYAKSYFINKVPERIPQVIIANPIKQGLPHYIGCEEGTIFITACRLNKQKNLHLMINSVKRVLDSGYECFLNIYGEGPMRQELEAYINSVGLDERVRLCGFSDSIHEKMAEATAFIISSDFEGISNSMLEALAIGIPVIATDCPVGGARQYILNEVNGYLVPCRDVDSMSKAMIDVIENPAKAIDMGKEATKIREIISTKNIAAQWMDFIDKEIAK
jgi:GalNAc-alpha-(1->4)-GalNAc-alpha-(1->3)-diNAcBac-PP-undecaprenol alpha-1,4-N-acetyl-D-galactosaminyltransferase